MLVMMIVMMTVVLLSSGHMGMMEHGAVQAEKTEETAQSAKAKLSPPVSSEHQH